MVSTLLPFSNELYYKMKIFFFSQNEVLKLYEQKLRETSEILQSKVKVIGVLQGEIGNKEKEILELGTKVKVSEERLAMTTEQMKLMQVGYFPGSDIRLSLIGKLKNFIL